MKKSPRTRDDTRRFARLPSETQKMVAEIGNRPADHRGQWPRVRTTHPGPAPAGLQNREEARPLNGGEPAIKLGRCPRNTRSCSDAEHSR